MYLKDLVIASRGQPLSLPPLVPVYFHLIPATIYNARARNRGQAPPHCPHE